MTTNEIYNRIKLQIKVKPFRCFLLTNDNFNILSFGINKTPTIVIHNNKQFFQNLNNLDMLRLIDGIYVSDNIIRCFLLWMKYQSAKIEFLNSQCFHGEEILKIKQKIDDKRKKFKIQIDFHTTSIRCTSKIEDDKRKHFKMQIDYHTISIRCKLVD